MEYKDRKTDLRRSRFSMKKLSEKEVSLWNIAPVWPGRDKAKMSEQQLADLMTDTYSASSDRAHLVLWMPATELHVSLFDPVTGAGPWLLQATIFSGSHPLHIGFVYSRSRSQANWGMKLILDTKGNRGSSSPATMKFVLKQLGDPGGLIVDPFAHKSAVLPIWARRFGIRYIGYQSSKRRWTEMLKSLAQVELPGIQLEIPA